MLPQDQIPDGALQPAHRPGARAACAHLTVTVRLTRAPRPIRRHVRCLQGRDLCAKLATCTSVIKTPPMQLQNQLAIEVRIRLAHCARAPRRSFPTPLRTASPSRKPELLSALFAASSTHRLSRQSWQTAGIQCRCLMPVHDWAVGLGADGDARLAGRADRWVHFGECVGVWQEIGGSM